MTERPNTIDFWLGGDRLPTDLVAHLTAANATKDPRVMEVVGLLEDLLSLVATVDHPNGLTRAEARAAIRSAMDFVFEGWMSQGVRDGTLTDADVASIDITVMPTREFMRGFVQALARQVRWKRNDIRASGVPATNSDKI